MSEAARIPAETARVETNTPEKVTPPTARPNDADRLGAAFAEQLADSCKVLRDDAKRPPAERLLDGIA